MHAAVFGGKKSRIASSPSPPPAPSRLRGMNAADSGICELLLTAVWLISHRPDLLL